MIEPPYPWHDGPWLTEDEFLEPAEREVLETEPALETIWQEPDENLEQLIASAYAAYIMRTEAIR